MASLIQVFEAEKMTGKYGYYHKKCFKCIKCKRPLDYQTLSEGRPQWRRPRQRSSLTLFPYIFPLTTTFAVVFSSKFLHGQSIKTYVQM
jgi:hypothetical protein